MPDFKIDDESFQALIAQQVLAGISEQSKDQLIAEALKFLTKNDTSYGRTSPSPLTLAFQQELVKIAGRIAQEVLSEEKIRVFVEDAIRDHIHKAITERGFDLSYVIGQAIGQNLDINFNSR